jgi:hypothetical protein
VHALAAAGLGEADEAELVEQRLQLERGLDHLLPAGAGHRVEVDPQLVGLLDVVAPGGPGWKSRQPLLAAHATWATSTGHSSVALRPLGKATVTVSSHGGRLSGTRFW